MAHSPFDRLPIVVAPVADGGLWMERALCAQTDPEAFFPEKGGSTREAKSICSRCEVRAECLVYTLANEERFGIGGGMSERERRRLVKQRRSAKAAAPSTAPVKEADPMPADAGPQPVADQPTRPQPNFQTTKYVPKEPLNEAGRQAELRQVLDHMFATYRGGFSLTIAHVASLACQLGFRRLPFDPVEAQLERFVAAEVAAGRLIATQPNGRTWVITGYEYGAHQARCQPAPHSATASAQPPSHSLEVAEVRRATPLFLSWLHHLGGEANHTSPASLARILELPLPFLRVLLDQLKSDQAITWSTDRKTLVISLLPDGYRLYNNVVTAPDTDDVVAIPTASAHQAPSVTIRPRDTASAKEATMKDVDRRRILGEMIAAAGPNGLVVTSSMLTDIHQRLHFVRHGKDSPNAQWLKFLASEERAGRLVVTKKPGQLRIENAEDIEKTLADAEPVATARSAVPTLPAKERAVHLTQAQIRMVAELVADAGGELRRYDAPGGAVTEVIASVIDVSPSQIKQLLIELADAGYVELKFKERLLDVVRLLPSGYGFINREPVATLWENYEPLLSPGATVGAINLDEVMFVEPTVVGNPGNDNVTDESDRVDEAGADEPADTTVEGATVEIADDETTEPVVKDEILDPLDLPAPAHDKNDETAESVLAGATNSLDEVEEASAVGDNDAAAPAEPETRHHAVQTQPRIDPFWLTGKKLATSVAEVTSPALMAAVLGVPKVAKAEVDNTAEQPVVGDLPTEAAATSVAGSVEPTVPTTPPTGRVMASEQAIIRRMRLIIGELIRLGGSAGTDFSSVRLAGILGCAQSTANKALLRLVEEGCIERQLNGTMPVQTVLLPAGQTFYDQQSASVAPSHEAVAEPVCVEVADGSAAVEVAEAIVAEVLAEPNLGETTTQVSVVDNNVETGILVDEVVDTDDAVEATSVGEASTLESVPGEVIQPVRIAAVEDIVTVVKLEVLRYLHDRQLVSRVDDIVATVGWWPQWIRDLLQQLHDEGCINWERKAPNIKGVVQTVSITVTEEGVARLGLQRAETETAVAAVTPITKARRPKEVRAIHAVPPAPSEEPVILDVEAVLQRYADVTERHGKGATARLSNFVDLAMAASPKLRLFWAQKVNDGLNVIEPPTSQADTA